MLATGSLRTSGKAHLNAGDIGVRRCGPGYEERDEAAIVEPVHLAEAVVIVDEIHGAQTLRCPPR